MNGIGSHHSAKSMKDEWLTPPWILDELGPFDLDPCAPVNPPWRIATKHYTIEDDGLKKLWFGRVWLNPPYNNKTMWNWFNKLWIHNNGIALIFARTETEGFFRWIWGKADAVLFLKGRIYFHHVTGEKARANSGGPSVLVAYGSENVNRLRKSNINGKFFDLADNRR